MTAASRRRLIRAANNLPGLAALAVLMTAGVGALALIAVVVLKAP
jgi:hypothetical protein